MQSVILSAPSYWAPYLINGDSSGMSESDIAACDDWIAAEGLGAPVSCDDVGFMRYHDASRFALPADCQDYVFLVSAPVLSLESAIQYVRDYFAKCGVKAPANLSAMHDSIDGIPFVQVDMGETGTFSVWLESGKLYGEY